MFQSFESVTELLCHLGITRALIASGLDMLFNLAVRLLYYL